MLLAVRIYRVMDAVGKFGEHSRSWSCSRLRFSRALQTSCVHLKLDISTLSMNQFLNGSVINSVYVKVLK